METIIWAGIATTVGVRNPRHGRVPLFWSVINRRFADLRSQLDQLSGRLDGRGLDRLDRGLDRLKAGVDGMNQRSDAIGRDVGELRDRTGALERAVSAFIASAR